MELTLNDHSHVLESPHPQRPSRHPWEIGLLVLVIVASIGLYVYGTAKILSGHHETLWLTIMATPILILHGRGRPYGKLKVNGVKMSPTQFPECYWLVIEAERRFGLTEVPDAYVVLGNGMINASAS